jgi:branched-chain amino acid transport system substrate-binding protein
VRVRARQKRWRIAPIEGGDTMTMFRGALIAGAMFAAAAASSQELRIGYISTMTGPGAAVGTHQLNGWKLGLAHEGWTKDGDKLGGVATRIFYGDDQFKPDVGLSEVEKMLKVHKVQIVAGFIWSNVLMAAQRPIVEAKVGLLITNAGASPVFGPLCNPLIVSTSWNSDQSAEALGRLISNEKIGKLYLMAPNYQAGKDVISGLKRTLKGPTIVGESFFKPGETDYQADISRVRASKPDALFIFAPGAMAPAFFKQWAASGVGRDVRLYTSNTVDHLTLPALGDAAVGSYHTLQWNVDLPNAANQRFVKDYVAKFGHMPSNYAQQAYDAPRLLAATLRATGGKIGDVGALMKAMRKTPYESTRGAYQYNVNGLPIQNFYRLDVVKGADGKPAIVTKGAIVEKAMDSYWGTCPAPMRY